jgi:hypothetical protein
VAYKAFYLGKWQVRWPAEGWETPSAWQLPKTTEDLHETSNVEELDIIPTDMFLTPEETQAGCDDWSINITTEDPFYYPRVPISNEVFYPNWYLGGEQYRGISYLPTMQIAPDFFYVTPIESGSRAGERTVLDFT